MEKMLVKGVTKDDDVARISVVGLPDKPGIAFKLFSLLAQNKINVDIILQSIGRDGTKDISFTVSHSNMDTAMNVLQDFVHAADAKDLVCDDNISKVSIVGAGMQSNAGVAAMMFEALMTAGVNIQMISTSEIKVSVLIDKKDADKAVQAIHDEFIS